MTADFLRSVAADTGIDPDELRATLADCRFDVDSLLPASIRENWTNFTEQAKAVAYLYFQSLEERQQLLEERRL